MLLRERGCPIQAHPAPPAPKRVTGGFFMQEADFHCPYQPIGLLPATVFNPELGAVKRRPPLQLEKATQLSVHCTECHGQAWAPVSSLQCPHPTRELWGSAPHRFCSLVWGTGRRLPGSWRREKSPSLLTHSYRIRQTVAHSQRPHCLQPNLLKSKCTQGFLTCSCSSLSTSCQQDFREKPVWTLARKSASPG